MSDDNVVDSEQQSSTAIKLSTAKQIKDIADQAFKQGDTTAALRSYHQSLMYLLGLDKNALQSIGVTSTPVPGSSKDGKDAKEKTEVDDLVEKIYANMSACHMKKENWKRAVETADKALAKNEHNYKALFRKGKALGEQGFYEKAVKILEDVKEKNPTDAGIVDAELSRLRIIDNQREKANKQKLKGMLLITLPLSFFNTLTIGFLNKAEKKAAAAEAPVAGSSSDPA